MSVEEKIRLVENMLKLRPEEQSYMMGYAAGATAVREQMAKEAAKDEQSEDAKAAG